MNAKQAELFYALNCWNCRELLPVEKTALNTNTSKQLGAPAPKSLPAIFSVKCSKCGDTRTCITEPDLEKEVLRPEWFPVGTQAIDVTAVTKAET